MTYQTEPQIQAIVRRVVAKMIRAAGAKILAEKLEAGDPHAVGDLQPLITEAQKAWEQEYKVVALSHQGIMWAIHATREDHKQEGPLVHLHWGWDEDETPKLTTSGEMAFDLAVEILELFTNEDGDPVRPERPEYEENPEVSRHFDKFSKLAAEFMETTGETGGCSWIDVNIWAQMGKPSPVPKHEWVDYPEDKVRICSACHHWYSTDPDRDDFPTRVCPQQPLDDNRIPTTDQFDPRRSPSLREAQRLDKLIHYMKHADATQKELEPLIDALAHHKNQLTEQELERYDNERIGR